jgi:virginiamycin B lyase
VIDGKITEFAGPTGGVLRSIAPGPDGNIWFVEDSRDTVGRITPSGRVTEYGIPRPPKTSPAQPYAIAPGPDGNLWFTEGARGGSVASRLRGRSSSSLSPTVAVSRLGS